MTTIEKIDTIYEQMQTKPLSCILPQVFPISLECGDYEGYCILMEWNTPLSQEKSANKTHRETIEQGLVLCGLSKEKAQQIMRTAFEQYLSLRTIGEDHWISPYHHSLCLILLIWINFVLL